MEVDFRDFNLLVRELHDLEKLSYEDAWEWAVRLFQEEAEEKARFDACNPRCEGVDSL
jgi:hypothetical protein